MYRLMKQLPTMEQLKVNVEECLEMYSNGMSDYGEGEYPQMTIDECRQYVTSEIYNFMSDGHGRTVYGDGICDNLKTLGNDVIYPIIDEVAKDLDIIKEVA